MAISHTCRCHPMYPCLQVPPNVITLLSCRDRIYMYKQYTNIYNILLPWSTNAWSNNDDVYCVNNMIEPRSTYTSGEHDHSIYYMTFFIPGTRISKSVTGFYVLFPRDLIVSVFYVTLSVMPVNATQFKSLFTLPSAFPGPLYTWGRFPPWARTDEGPSSPYSHGIKDYQTF